MPEIIGAIVLVAITYGGTIAADEIHNTARKAALTKAAQGLPRLSTFAQSLTTKAKTHYSRK